VLEALEDAAYYRDTRSRILKALCGDPRVEVSHHRGAAARIMQRRHVTTKSWQRN